MILDGRKPTLAWLIVPLASGISVDSIGLNRGGEIESAQVGVSEVPGSDRSSQKQSVGVLP